METSAYASWVSFFFSWHTISKLWTQYRNVFCNDFFFANITQRTHLLTLTHQLSIVWRRVGQVKEQICFQNW